MHEVRPGGSRNDAPHSAPQAPQEPSRDPRTPPRDIEARPSAADEPQPEAEASRDSPEGGLTAEGPRPLDVGIRPTGDGEIDARLGRLAEADHLAVSGHLEVYEDVHRGLRSTLTALDQHDPGS